MNRQQFMSELNTLLQSMSPDERKEALKYYEDYFEDAGPYREQEVIDEFGSPAKLAQVILVDTDVQDTKLSSAVSHSKSLGGGLITLIIILSVFLFPITFSLSITVVTVVFLLYICVVSLALILAFASVLIFMGGVILIGSGIGKAFEILWGGLSMVCCGIVMSGCGLMFLAISLWLIFFLLPWMWRTRRRVLHISEGGVTNA